MIIKLTSVYYEDRVLDGLASGENGSNGSNQLDCNRVKRRKAPYRPEYEWVLTHVSHVWGLTFARGADGVAQLLQLRRLSAGAHPCPLGLWGLGFLGTRTRVG